MPRPAPAPPKGAPNKKQTSTFNSFVSNDDRNNNYNVTVPTVIRPVTGFQHKKKAPPPRPAPPKHYPAKQNTACPSAVSQRPDLLADLCDIFGHPQAKPINQTKQLSQTVNSGLNSNVRSGSSRWKKAPAPPKPVGRENRFDQLSLIDFDSVAPASSVLAANRKPAIDLLCEDPFDQQFQKTVNVFQTNSNNSSVWQNRRDSSNELINKRDYSVFDRSSSAFSQERSVFDQASLAFDQRCSVFDQRSSVFDQRSSVFDQKKSIPSHKNLFCNQESIASTHINGTSSANAFIPAQKSECRKSTDLSPAESVEKSERRSLTFSPPEPKFPPPPPPPADDQSVVQCQALYDFSSSDPEELEFVVGDILLLTDKVSSDWWKGSLNGRSGLFPSSYVQVIEEEAVAEKSLPTNLVTALYDFKGEQAQDLTFKAGDEIEVLYRINQNWLFGKCGSKEGHFPANFVQKTSDQTGGLFRAKYNFEAENEDEISFWQDDIICVVEKSGSDWWKGYRQDDVTRKVGLVPATFIEHYAS